MKRAAGAAIALVLIGALDPGQASAQISVGISAGATLPTGAYGEAAKTGWIGLAGFTAPVGDAGLAVGAHGFFGSNSHEAPNGDKTNLYGALASLGFALPAQGSLLPYVFGGLGFMAHAYRSDTYPGLEYTQSGLAFGAGAGVGFPVAGVQGTVDAWWVTGSGDIDRTKLFGLTVGASFPLDVGM